MVFIVHNQNIAAEFVEHWFITFHVRILGRIFLSPWRDRWRGKVIHLSKESGLWLSRGINSNARVISRVLFALGAVLVLSFPQREVCTEEGVLMGCICVRDVV